MVSLPGKRTVLGPAPVWRRLFAFIIDLLILNVIFFFPFQSMIEGLIPNGGWETIVMQANANLAALETITAVLGIVALLYFTFFEAALAKTPGKHLMHILVASESPQPSFWRMMIRNLYVLPIFPFILLWLLEPLFMIFSKDQQRLLERLSKTRTMMNHAVDA